MPKDPAIAMKDVSFAYGKKKILKGFSLEIEEGKTYCLIGSSGSGKTTALRLMNGLLRPQAGHVVLRGQELDFTQSEKVRRQMGYSMQGSGLFPHMSLYENLTIIARKEAWSKSRLDVRVRELCELMSLPATEDFLHKKPRQISGGQQQRVGMARALFMKPRILLMDEPFSALDPITRSELHQEFIRLQKKLKLTIVIVTHDLSEAFLMGDEIVLLNEGKIEQQGKPSKFLLSPASPFVDNFMHSHSPGNILKEVYLYSVMNPNVWSSLKTSQSLKLVNIETSESKSFSTVDEMKSFLQSYPQTSIYWVDENKKLLSFEELDGPTFTGHLSSTDHILLAMKTLLKVKSTTLPVVNETKELVGVFSQEALDAL